MRREFLKKIVEEGEKIKLAISKHIKSPKELEEFFEEAISYTKKTLTRQAIHGSGKRYRKDGALIDVEFHAVPVVVDGKVVGAYGIYQDITDRVRAETALQESEERFRAFIGATTFEGIILNREGVIADINDQFAKMYGYEREELIGMKALDTIAPESRDYVRKMIQERREEPYEAVALRKDGSTFPIEVHARTINYRGKTVRAAAIRDMTERKELENRLAHEATHDPLTSLPNRILLKDRLDQAIRSCAREKKKLALFILDLDHFKEINDTLGHYSGDRLLRRVALRLKGTVRESDTVARLGGDEFAIIFPSIEKIDLIRVMVKKILQTFREPFLLDGMNLEVLASIGIAAFPDHGRDVDTLMQRADVAMYIAKQEKNKFAIYSQKFHSHNPKRLTLMGELRQAIENNDLILFYQPKIAVNSRNIEGVEALVRWQHVEHGIISPDEFIPLAERTGLIDDLTYWVLRTGMHQLVSWHSLGLRIGMAVNISPSTLLNYDLPDVITGLMARYEIDPGFITLEITEGSLIKNPARALEILTRLNEMGIKISIDDFGTGYSSLAYLKKLPASEVKIDKSFVLDMLHDENDAVIVKTTIELAHNLGMKVTAEGVETGEIALQLKNLGCDNLQGYYFSRPCKEKDFIKWVKSQVKKKH